MMPDLLQDIVKPTVSILNRDSGARLCSYELEEQHQEVRAQYTSVTMCRVYRSAQ